MNLILPFIKDNFLLVLVVVVLVIIVVKVVKSFIRWIFTLIILVAVAFYGIQYYAPQHLKDMTNQVVDVGVGKARDQAIADLISSTSVQYSAGKDGNFTITSGDIKLEGNVGSKTANLVVFGKKIPIEITSAIQVVIDKAKTSS